MNLARAARMCLSLIVAGAIAALMPSSLSHAQGVSAAGFDPLRAYVGTWTATTPNERAPFLVLKFNESNGALTGTMSHFKVKVIGHGKTAGTPLMTSDSPISDLKPSDSGVSFEWKADAPLHGGRVLFVAEGTSVAYMVIPVSAEERNAIFLENPGIHGFSPIIYLRREGEATGEDQRLKAVEKWRARDTARLINQAEWQYRITHGAYTDYATLLHAGLLATSARRSFTVVPMNLDPATDPLPGYLIRLLLSQDRNCYQFMIREKTPSACASSLSSDETGVIFDGKTADCSDK